ncbi:MAG: hypothetical protein ACFFGZ_08900 [Candidatus Thorarchaeota archaeon]
MAEFRMIRTEAGTDFQNQVNDALKEGWQVINCTISPKSGHYHAFLIKRQRIPRP